MRCASGSGERTLTAARHMGAVAPAQVPVENSLDGLEWLTRRKRNTLMTRSRQTLSIVSYRRMVGGFVGLRQGEMQATGHLPNASFPRTSFHVSEAPTPTSSSSISTPKSYM